MLVYQGAATRAEWTPPTTAGKLCGVPITKKTGRDSFYTIPPGKNQLPTV